jgi:hypothetical protein
MSIMVLELTGSRILAPFLGTSTYVWTSLIGIILACLSVGYFVGGRWADQNASYRNLSIIIFLAAFYIFLVAQFQYYILDFISTNVYGIRTGSILSGVVLFAAPSTLLAMVFPHLVRLKLKNLEKTGQTVGNLDAVSTIGSIFGTFLAGFILVTYFSNSQILLFESILLFLVGLLNLWPFLRKVYLFFIVLLVLVSYQLFSNVNSFQANYLAWVDTPYQTLKVFDTQFGTETIRALRTDPFGTQGATFLNNNELVFDYLKYFDLYKVFSPEAETALMIGAGVYAYPVHFIKGGQNLRIDVVDIDEQITNVSKNYFGLKESNQINIFHEDGRMFINRAKTIYDVIFLDAFNSLSVPYQLTTLEFLNKAKRNLSADGMILTNIITSLEGPNSKFLHASLKTHQKIFAETKLFAVGEMAQKTDIQNVILIGCKATGCENPHITDENLLRFLQSEVNFEIPSETKILTDDFAPVDSYMLSLFESKRRQDFFK